MKTQLHAGKSQGRAQVTVTAQLRLVSTESPKPIRLAYSLREEVATTLVRAVSALLPEA